MNAQDLQLLGQWSDAEISRIATRVEMDYRSAMTDHTRRIAMWRDYYRRWRARVLPPKIGEEDKSNLIVPLIRWNILTKWAKEIDSLFGEKAEIIAVPTGPSDHRKDAKISRYMTWRVFQSMKLLAPFCEFVLRKLIFGRSVAYSPWSVEEFESEGQWITEYVGPGFEPLFPDDFIVPCEEVRSLHDFSFVARRYRISPDQLLEGEEQGRYAGIAKNWDRILNQGRAGMKREFQGEEIKREQDDAEGLSYTRPLSSGEWLTVIEWYGRWRPLKKGRKDGSEMDFRAREMRQREYVVRYLPDLNMVVSVQDLAQVYPHKKRRRPFVETSLFKDGSYWCPGMAELLCDMEDELSANHNQATEAGQLAMNPPVGYRPASGFNPETFTMRPGLSVPLDNPQHDVKQIEIRADMGIAQWKEQAVLAYGERLTGQSDLQMGRQADRPNAPRTARQTIALLEEGNVRISLDTKVLREDMAGVLLHFWELEYSFSDEETFFRVTEDDAAGLFPVQDGGSTLTRQDRDGRYDFRLQFADSVFSREAKKEQALARYQLDLTNPLIVQNPVALWEATKKVHEALGDPNFQDIVPRPPEPDISVDPKEEFNRLLQGEDILVVPTDNDQLHMMRHYRDLQAAEQRGDMDQEILRALAVHYRDHMVQLQAKRIQQAVLEQAAQAAASLMQQGPPMPGAPSPAPAGGPPPILGAAEEEPGPGQLPPLPPVPTKPGERMIEPE